MINTEKLGITFIKIFIIEVMVIAISLFLLKVLP